MNIRRTRTALTTAAVAGPLALALVACGGDDDSSAADTTPVSASQSTSTSAPSPESGATSTTTDDGATTDPTPAPSGDVLAVVARTALGAVDGTVFTIDSDDGVWDVTVVKADGTEWDLEVSADGSTVTREPREDLDDDDADDARENADDLAERRTLLADTRVGLTEALTTARAEVPGVEVTGTDLDLDRGTPTWEVQLGEDSADEHEVTLDAVTGDVVRVERDD